MTDKKNGASSSWQLNTLKKLPGSGSEKQVKDLHCIMSLLGISTSTAAKRFTSLKQRQTSLHVIFLSLAGSVISIVASVFFYRLFGQIFFYFFKGERILLKPALSILLAVKPKQDIKTLRGWLFCVDLSPWVTALILHIAVFFHC